MKRYSIIALVSLLASFSYSAKAQDFLKQHYFPEGATKYSCIMKIGTNYMIAGTQEGSINYVVLIEIDPQGDIVSQHRVKLADGAEPVIPQGIVWDASGSDPFVVVAGYMGDINPDFARPIVFKYNYNTNTVAWSNQIDQTGIYTDIETLSTGDYVVSGEIMDAAAEQENALIYKINKTTGAPSGLYEATDSAGLSETYYALNVNNDKITACGRFELVDGGAAGYMRPVNTVHNTTSGSTSSYFYLQVFPDAANPARLYPLDITRTGGNYYYTVVTGDIDGSSLNRDLFVMRTYGNTFASTWQRRIILTATENDCEGALNSIKLYNPDTHINYPIVFGTLCNGANLGSTAFMFRLSQNGSTVQWINRYDAHVQFNTFGTLCPNSMIVDGDKIYAVGWSMAENFVGAVLCTNVADGVIGDCSEAMTIPSTENTDLEWPITLPNSTVNFDPSELRKAISVPTGYELAPCEDEIGRTPSEETVGNDVTDLFLSIQQSSSQTDFYLIMDETTSDYSIRIIDITGKNIMAGGITADEHVSATLTAGMYIAMLYENNRVIESQKFVVK